MTFFRPEASPAGAEPGRTGVLLCNLGTPAAPTAEATRRYLAQFLSDRRVVELPRLPWLMLLHGLVLRTRPRQSAAKYQTVWLPEGSPLLVWSQRQELLLRGYLGERGVNVPVRLAMRYGEPSIAAGLDDLRRQGCTQILVLPLYPQYSGSTTASVFDAVSSWGQRARHVPELRFVRSFHDDAGYIQALARTVREQWGADGPPDKLVLSFHGVPQRMVDAGDPYEAQCHDTAEQLAHALGLAPGQWAVSFQSRFGKAKWVGPATQQVLQELGRAGTRRVDVICPGFVADCLETLEEIAMEGRDDFVAAGGGELRYLPALNDHPSWIRGLADLVQRHIQGWPT